MRIVDDAGDAGIDAAERGDEIAGIDVFGPINLGEGQMGGGGVGVERRGIGIDAAELAYLLPSSGHSLSFAGVTDDPPHEA